MRRNFDFRLLRKHADIHIATWEAFYKTSSGFADFIPVAPLQQMIQSYAGGFKNVIGVHIRRTDNANSVEHSPTELFLQAMQDEVAADPAVGFFLATDDPDEEKNILKNFPDRITVHKKESLHREDPAAIRDALVDVYCLSRCRKIIGSYWSSFTEVAHLLRGAEMHLAIRQKP